MKQKALSLMLSLMLLTGILIPADGHSPGFPGLSASAGAEGIESEENSESSVSSESSVGTLTSDSTEASDSSSLPSVSSASSVLPDISFDVSSASSGTNEPFSETAEQESRISLPDSSVTSEHSGKESEPAGSTSDNDTASDADPLSSPDGDSSVTAPESPSEEETDDTAGAEKAEKKNEPETEVSDSTETVDLSSADGLIPKAEDPASDIVSATSNDSTADSFLTGASLSDPITPVDLALTSESLTSITLTFSGTSSAPYQVYRSTKKYGEYIPLGYAWEPFSGTGKYSFEDPNAVKGILYFYKVRWESGTSASARMGEFSTIIYGCSQPAALPKVTGSATAAKVITISWPAQEGISGYQVQRSTNYDSGFKTLSNNVSKKSVSYQDKTVKPGMQYYYRVRAYYRKSGTRYYGPYTVSSVVLCEPVPPEDFTVTAATETSVTLGWTPAAGVRSYMLDWSYTTGGEKIKGSVSGIDHKKRTYEITNISSGAKITFQIRSVLTTSGGTEMRSGVSQLIYTLPAASKPTLSASENTGTDAQNPRPVVTHSDGEQLSDSSCTEGLPEKEISDNPDEGLSEADEPLPVSEDSEDLIEKSPLTEAPTISSAVYISSSQGNPGVILSWQPVPGAQYYRVYRSEKKKAVGVLLADQLTETEYRDVSAKSGAGYYYRISAVDADSQELISSPYGFYSASAIALTAKKNSSGYYTFTWGMRANADRYILYRSTDGGEYKAVKTIDGQHNHSYTDSTVKAGKTYTYAVTALRTVDGVMTAGTPGVPFTCYMGVTENPVVTVTQDPSVITLAWDPVPDADGYVISGSAGDGTLTELARVGKSVTSWSGEALASSGYIRYYVCAYYKLGSTKYFAPDSNPVSVLRLSPPQLMLSRGETANTIDVTWSAVIGAERYLLYYKQAGESAYHCLETAALSTVIPAESGAAVSVYVRAAAEDQGKEVQGSRSAIRSMTPYWKYALLIGNNKYNAASSMVQLAATAADIAGISVVLNRQNGWNVKTCANMTGPEILSEISAFLSQADRNSTCLFYYSGHGTQGRNSETGSLCGIDGSYVSPAQLKAALDQLPGKSIILMDSCGSGAIVENESGAPTLDGDQYSVITASAAYQTSYASRFYSYFSYYLSFGTGWDYYTRQTLSSVPADTNKDGTVTLQEAAAYVLRYLTLSTVTTKLPEPSLPLVSP